MPYNNFSIDRVKKEFNLEIVETNSLFNASGCVPDTWLVALLNDFIPLATSIGTEKARSEFIIAPILAQVKKLLNNEISLFSGIKFDVDSYLELVGYADFILSSSKNQTILSSPVVCLVEAKKDNLKNGIGQCIAEMVAAEIFNKREENGIDIIYGVVTTGTNWRFMKLQYRRVTLDTNEYFINELETILTILVNFFS